MDSKVFELEHVDIAWCPGCGDFAIMEALKKALAELEIAPNQVVLASGIGQAAKLPHFMNGHFFNGLHGRSLPCATAMKAANRNLKVIAISGGGRAEPENYLHSAKLIGANRTMKKPFTNEEMLGAVRELLA